DAESDLALLERLLNSRNDTVNPCENFYKYACSRWEGKQSSRAREESLNVFDVLLEENLLILKRLLESSQFGVRGSAKEKAIQFYRSCMDTERIESQGAQPLKDLLNQVGGWHNTGVRETKDFNETLQILMSNYSTFPFFRVHVGPSPFDPKTNIIQIDHPEFDIPLESEFKEKNYLEVLRVYLSYLKKLGVLLGWTEDGPSDSFSLTLSFISNLQQFVTPLQKRRQRGMLFFRTTIRELQEKAPAIDWLACLNAVFYSMPMNLSQPIAVHDMDYLSNMSQLIEKWMRKGNKESSLSSLSCVSTSLFLQIPAERWRKCLTDTSSFFEAVLGKMFVQEIFPEQTKKFVGIHHLKPPSRVQLHLFLFLTYHLKTTSRQQNHLKGLSVKYGVNTFSNFSFHFASSWHVHPWSVHSYYSIRDHIVVFPAGMFRSPFFRMEFPSAVNFGAIGVFMAHEILHSFYGYVLPEGCPECNRSALQRSIDCLVEQYESYSLNINGTFTLLENTADTGGLAVAYQAYKNWLKNHKEEKDLPKIGLSHDQLFYLSFAHVMNASPDPEKLHSSLNTDPHSPLPLRVSGPVSNSQDFSKSFQCPRGSPMNPDIKCRIW
uniref:KELL protein n=1 Tax=Catharus ustulatus TaxID=91951 RepID=A0A8C3TNW7_CATUS